MTKEELLAENVELSRQLAEAEEALAAIRSGQVDAIITDGAAGPQVFSLAGSETVYRLAVETMAEAVLNVTLDGTILFCNARFSELVGTPHEQLLGRDLDDFVPPEDRDGFRELFAQCLQEPVKQRVVFRSASGTLKPTHLSGHVLTQGDESSLCLVAADLTELENSTQQIEQLRQTQAELRESRRTALNIMEDALEARQQAEQSAAALAEAHRQMQDLIDNTTANVYACDLEERFVLANASLAALLKTTPAQMIGKRRHEFMPQADAEAHEAADRKVIAAGRAVEFEEHSDLHGRSITWLSTKFPLRDAQGRIYAVAGIVTDITARKQAEKAVKTLNEELEQRVAQRTAELREKDQLLLVQGRQAAMGEMIGNIAHQWRQPLNSLGLIIQQLPFFYELGDFSKEYLDETVASSMKLIQHMSQTINDFRNFFKPDKQKAIFKVKDAISAAVTLIEDRLKHQFIDVKVNVQDDPEILGYKNEYSQALLNILNNAMDALTGRKVATPGIVIALSMADGKSVVTISDNAGGIPEEILAKVFDPYFSTKGPQQGTGLGLFMAKTIIEKNMGGVLTVRNDAEGAEFRIEM